MCAALYAGYGFIPIPFCLEISRLRKLNLIGGGLHSGRRAVRCFICGLRVETGWSVHTGTVW